MFCKTAFPNIPSKRLQHLFMINDLIVEGRRRLYSTSIKKVFDEENLLKG